jgi:hypothetical protein
LRSPTLCHVSLASEPAHALLDPVVQLSPPLLAGPAEFDEIEQILRGVLTEAWSRL